MLIIPAIDLYDDSVVRLHRGSYEEVTRYGTDPAAVARRFVAAGARRIHIVDLSAARSDGSNREAIRAIRNAVDCELEIGGGVRSMEDAERLKNWGLDYLVAGTVYAKNPGEVRRWIDRLGVRVIAGIDARDGIVRIRGWEESAGTTPCELLRTSGDIGISAVEYTNIANDGAFTGPDLDGTEALTACIENDGKIPVIASGGVRNIDDIAAAAARPAVGGVIIGRALYEDRLDLSEAIDRYGE